MKKILLVFPFLLGLVYLSLVSPKELIAQSCSGYGVAVNYWRCTDWWDMGQQCTDWISNSNWRDGCGGDGMGHCVSGIWPGQDVGQKCNASNLCACDGSNRRPGTHDVVCSGVSYDNQAGCTQPCVSVNGGWGGWSGCYVGGLNSCVKDRACNNPSPSCGGAGCSGDNWTFCSAAEAGCNNENCPSGCGYPGGIVKDGTLDGGCGCGYKTCPPVNCGGTAPTCQMTTCPSSGVTDQSYSFDASASDPEGDLSEIEIWSSPITHQDWQNVADSCGGGNCSGSQSFSSAGDYYVVCNAFDSSGNQCTGNPFDIPPPWEDCGANDSCIISISPPGACSVIQGFKVVMPGNVNAEPAASQTVSVSGSGSSGSSTANPYFLAIGDPEGTKTVSVSVPSGYTAGYTLCMDSIGCHGNPPTPGSSVTFDCSDDSFADLWWHFTPDVPNCSNVTGPSTVTLGDTENYCADFFSPGTTLQGEINVLSPFERITREVNLTPSGDSFCTNWTPSSAGNYDVCCRAWNDGIAECRPPAMGGIGGAVYACTGPNYCRSVSVVPPLPLLCPNGFNVNCSVEGTSVTIDWNNLTDAARYVLRVNGVPYGDWFGPGDYFNEPIASTDTFSVDPDREYTYDVQGIRAGESYPYAGCREPFERFTCSSCVPNAPTGLSPSGALSCQSQVTLTWNAVAGADRYAIRVDDLTDGWDCGNPNDTCEDNVVGTSYTLPVIDGRSYKWWVHVIKDSCGWSPSTSSSFDVAVCCTPSCTLNLIPISVIDDVGDPPSNLAAVIENVPATCTLQEARFSSNNPGIASVSPATDASSPYVTQSTCNSAGNTTVSAQGIVNGVPACSDTSNITCNTPPPLCDWGGWVDGSCGGGVCPADRRQQTRWTNPPGCVVGENCAIDPACPLGPSACTAPALNGFTTTTCTDPNFSIQWTWDRIWDNDAGAWAAQYQFQVTDEFVLVDDSGWVSAASLGCGDGVCEYTSLNHTPGDNYYGWVRTRGACLQSNWSSVVSTTKDCDSCSFNLLPGSVGIDIGGFQDFIISDLVRTGTVNRVDFDLLLSAPPGVASLSKTTDNFSPYTTTATADAAGSVDLRANMIMNGLVVCSDTSPINVLNPGPWWQASEGDVVCTQTGGPTCSIVSTIPASASDPYLITSSTSDPGIPISGGLIDSGFGSVSEEGWEVRDVSYTSSGIFDYTYFSQRIPDNATFSDPGGSADVNDLVDNSGGYGWQDPDTGYYWYSTSTLDLNGGNIGSSKIVLFVDGDLTILGNISLTLGQGFFMAVVRGETTIADDVSDLEGLYYTGGEFLTTDNPGNDIQLRIRGSVAVDGDIELERDLNDNSDFPAEVFEYAPDQAFLFPEELSEQSILWREVAP